MSEFNDRIDEMLEQVRTGNMKATSMSDFDKLAKQAQHIEDLSEIYRMKAAKSGYVSQRVTGEANSRYDYFMQGLDSLKINPRSLPSYQQGFAAALERYINKVDLNRNNLSIVDKTLAQEMLRVGRNASNYVELPLSLSSPNSRKGYWEGLEIINQLLKQSKALMMQKVANTVLDALKK